MTLTLKDEMGTPVTEAAPMVTEHNGTKGETVDRILTLRNTASRFGYRELVVLAKVAEGVTVYMGLRKADLAAKRSKLAMDELGPAVTRDIYVRVIVAPNQPEAVVKTTAFTVKAMKYPMR